MTRTDTVTLVVRWLARLSLLLVGGALYLTWVVIDQAAKIGPVDPTAVALVGSAWALAGAVVTALATLLVSTKSGPTEEEMAELAALTAPPTVETMEVEADEVNVA